MKKFTISLCCIALPVLFSSCQKQQQQAAASTAPPPTEQKAPDPADEAELLQRGDGIADKLMQSLGSKLKAALQAGGPEHALMVCQQLAQPSTTLVSAEFEGASIKRVSLKPRNPRNTPDELDRKVLTDWQKQVDAGQDVPKSEVHAGEDGTAVFYRPIMTQAVCMNCHGDPASFSQGLTEKLAELYPEDKATGYGIGQLRGAFRVEFLQGE